MSGLPARRVRTSEVPIERDKDGYPLCRACKKSIRDGKRPKQRTFCGNPECLHLWKLRSDTNYQAEHVLERDKGMCAKCGLDCIALLTELKQERLTEAIERLGEKVHHARLALIGSHFPKFWARCDALGLPRHHRMLERRLWEMDHIVPVVEGGGSCGLENLRTLCWECHRNETAALAARRAQARRAG